MVIGTDEVAVMPHSTLIKCSCSSSVFFITAPDVFHYGREESVLVNVLDSSAPITVDVYLEDYPNRGRTFSRKSVRVEPSEPVNE